LNELAVGLGEILRPPAAAPTAKGSRTRREPQPPECELGFFVGFGGNVFKSQVWEVVDLNGHQDSAQP
jgi:hypothetical protein